MTKLRLSLTVILLLMALPLLAQKYQLPDYQKFKLKSGLTVYLMEQHEVPIISVSAVFPAGAVYDGNKAGLASFTADGLLFGTKSFTKEVLDETLDFMGATVRTSSSKEFASLQSLFAAKDREAMLNIIQEVIMYPNFDTAEFSRHKARSLVGLEQQKESPSSMIRPYFDKFFYGNHPYGAVVQGTIPAVSNLNADDIRRFYQSHYRPEISAIAIVGDFNSREMKKTITKLFGAWKMKGALPADPAASSVKSPSAQRVLLVNKDDARQSTFYIGSQGVARNHPDLVPLQVLNTYFGGRFTSLLNDELRVNSGLTYGARSTFTTLKNSGTFFISTFTANKTTKETIDKALQVLNDFVQNGIDEKNLQSAKNYIKGQFPPRYETASQLSSLLTEMFWYKLNNDYINSFEQKVDGLTVDKANALIKQHFPSKLLQFVVIGKADEIRDVLKVYGPITEKDIKGEVE